MKISLVKLWNENKGLIVFILLMSVFRSSIADWYHVPTGSMKPTIVEGDRIFVNKMAYRLDIPFTDIPLAHLNTPARGDIVVIKSQAADNRLVKRVIGLPGDIVAMYDNKLIVNGEPVEYVSTGDYQALEKVADNPSKSYTVQWLPVGQSMSAFKPVSVPEGHLLVLGDNRNKSADSRYYGFVPIEELAGKALRVVASFNPDNYYLPRKSRFFESI